MIMRPTRYDNGDGIHPIHTLTDWVNDTIAEPDRKAMVEYIQSANVGDTWEMSPGFTITFMQ